jgi:hypothetical protein
MAIFGMGGWFRYGVKMCSMQSRTAVNRTQDILVFMNPLVSVLSKRAGDSMRNFHRKGAEVAKGRKAGLVFGLARFEG